ncbi:MAG: hypothetical protein GTN71_16095 [Anaerolineae bacterium]|nr:hypothetical protein [Anaerolineae bacterium]
MQSAQGSSFDERRAFHRVPKLARTISDLTASERIETSHLAEAIQSRPGTHYLKGRVGRADNI